MHNEEHFVKKIAEYNKKLREIKNEKKRLKHMKHRVVQRLSKYERLVLSSEETERHSAYKKLIGIK